MHVDAQVQNKDMHEIEKQVHNHDNEKYMMVSYETKKVDKKSIPISCATGGPSLCTLFSFLEYNLKLQTYFDMEHTRYHTFNPYF